MLFARGTRSACWLRRIRMCNASFMLIQRSIRSLLYLLFAVCPLLFFTDLTRNPYFTQIALLNFLVPACWLLWLIHMWRQGELRWVTTPVDKPLLALIAFSFFSWGASALSHRVFV